MAKDIQRQSATTKSSDDFELSIKREKDVLYHYSYLKDVKLKGIVFIIAGFGEDTNSDYTQKLRDYVAQKFEVVAVSVIYHCFSSRLNNGGVAYLDEIDKKMLVGNMKLLNISPNVENIDDLLLKINQAVQSLKDRGKIEKNMSIFQSMTILPKNNEYQNFGVLQALDHINVLQDIKNKKLDFIENYPTILMGSSHGGYIANMIAKIAPNSIDCVIDNSSYVKPPLSYIVGKEESVNFGEYIVLYKDNLKVNYFVKTMWTKDENSFYHFSKDRFNIRDLSKKSHNKVSAKESKSKTKYVFYHSTQDTLAKYEEKEAFSKQLEELGYEVTLRTLSDASQVDGKFIKSLEHGLNMSMKELANTELPLALNIKSNSSNNEPNSISFECESVKYNFENIDATFSASITPIQKIEDKVIECFNNNMQYFEKNQPHLYSKIASLDSALEQGLYENRYDLVFNNNNFNVKEYATNDYLYAENSNKYAYEVTKNYEDMVDKFISFGVGLGVHLTQNKKAKSYLLVEDDLELFKLSTFVTPYYEIAKSAELMFCVFEDEEVFSKTAREFLGSLKGVEMTLNSFEINHNYENKKIIFGKIVNEI